ncbi:MAG: hypothetical protein QOC90_2555, partial [Mycobacterium sp.]|nr:hypothetical protein [Mycobacterium sp.]
MHPLHQLGRRDQPDDGRNVGAPRLAGGRPGHRTPASQTLVDLRLSFPPGHTARGLPRDERVGARLGGQLDGQLGAIGLGQSLHDGDRGRGRRHSPAVQHPRRQPALGDFLDDTVRHGAVAVAEIEFFAYSDAPNIGRVETLVAVDDRQLSDLGQRVDVEQSAAGRAMRISEGHRKSSAGEGFAQPAEESATSRRILGRPNLRHVVDALFLQLVQQLDVLVVKPRRHHNIDVGVQVTA